MMIDRDEVRSNFEKMSEKPSIHPLKKWHIAGQSSHVAPPDSEDPRRRYTTSGLSAVVLVEKRIE